MRKRIVITGAPCSGKTTLIDKFNEQGWMTYPEQARIYIERELNQGKTLDEIRADKTAFQYAILKLNQEVEQHIGILLSDKENTGADIIMDRAIPDTLGFCYAFDLSVTDELKAACSSVQYDAVFLLSPLPFQSDAARNENTHEQMLIHEGLKLGYQSVSAPLIEVPVLSVEERMQFMFQQIKNLANGVK